MCRTSSVVLYQSALRKQRHGLSFRCGKIDPNEHAFGFGHVNRLRATFGVNVDANGDRRAADFYDGSLEPHHVADEYRVLELDAIDRDCHERRFRVAAEELHFALRRDGSREVDVGKENATEDGPVSVGVLGHHRDLNGCVWLGHWLPRAHCVAVRMWNDTPREQGEAMNEVEWLSCTKPRRMLGFLQNKATPRKQRLVLCACGRLISHLFPSEAWRDLIGIGERYADGEVTEEERETRLRGAIRSQRDPVVGLAISPLHSDFSYSWLGSALASIDRVAPGSILKQCAVLRCLFNPFHPVSLEPSWLTSDVLALARRIYDERDFDGMPILADALQDAGCANEDVLNHCRDANQVHVRGCWVVDLLLQKE